MWAIRITREHHERLARGGVEANYLSADVGTLRNGMRRFADAFDREQADRELQASFGAVHYVEVPSQATSDLDAAVEHGATIALSVSWPAAVTLGVSVGPQRGQLARSGDLATAA